MSQRGCVLRFDHRTPAHTRPTLYTRHETAVASHRDTKTEAPAKLEQDIVLYWPLTHANGPCVSSSDANGSSFRLTPENASPESKYLVFAVSNSFSSQAQRH